MRNDLHFWKNICEVKFASAHFFYMSLQTHKGSAKYHHLIKTNELRFRISSATFSQQISGKSSQHKWCVKLCCNPDLSIVMANMYVQGRPNNIFFWKMLKKTTEYFLKFFFYLKVQSFRLIVENNACSSLHGRSNF